VCSRRHPPPQRAGPPSTVRCSSASTTSPSLRGRFTPPHEARE
jgi:hypothetical protein